MTRVVFGAVALALFILTLLLFPAISASGDLGLCLPSPNLWPLSKFGGWIVNTLLVFVSAAAIGEANKKYNFIPEADSIMPAALLVLVACNCLSTATLSTSTLLLACNVAAFHIIFSTYEERNATREFFIVATLVAIGAMFQYAFLVMIPVYIGAGLFMKSFRLRELIAFIFGLAAPYWIVVGLGVIPFDAFRWPGKIIVLNGNAVESDIFLTLLAAGIMALLGFILSLYNGVRLFSRNSRLRSMHSSINLMGYLSTLAIIFDFDNFVAYFATISLWLAVEGAAMLHFYNVRHPKIALFVLLCIFLPFYVLSI